MDGQDSRKPHRERPAGDQPFVKRAPERERPAHKGPYGKPAGERKPFERGEPREERPDYKGPYGKPSGERKPFERRERQGERPARKGPYGKPAGERKPFERRETREERPDHKDPYGKPAGERKPFERRETREGRPYPKGPYVKSAGEGRPFERRGPEQPMRQNRPFAPRTPRPQGIRPVPAVPIKPSLSPDARRTALNVLNRVLIDEGFASLSLDEQFQQTSLAPRDKRLATALVYTTLENLTKVDFALDQFLKDRTELEPRVLNLLRMSTSQLILMDKVPDFAAVNEAVNMARDMGLEPMTGLVNGVLRSLIRERENIPWPKVGDPNYLCVTYSVPAWLLERLTEGYGAGTAEQIAAYRREQHSISIRRNTLRISEKDFSEILKKKVWQVTPGLVPDVYHIAGAASIARDTHFLDGTFSIQGEGSILAALALAPAIGARVLDACAAPGGKTCLMAELMQNTGRIHAWDVHEHRVRLIEAQLERLRIYNVRPAVRDASVYQERFEGEMDAVLLDAPCSGTGVMAEKPDVKQRLKPEDMPKLVDLQRRLLGTVSRYVKPGGILVYATCSLLPEENSQQIEWFLKEHPEFTSDPLPASIPEGIRALGKENGLQLLPHRDGMEGFFIARLKKA